MTIENQKNGDNNMLSIDTDPFDSEQEGMNKFKIQDLILILLTNKGKGFDRDT